MLLFLQCQQQWRLFTSSGDGHLFWTPCFHAKTNDERHSSLYKNFKILFFIGRKKTFINCGNDSLDDIDSPIEETPGLRRKRQPVEVVYDIPQQSNSDELPAPAKKNKGELKIFKIYPF